jgi:mannose/fructose/N-acetylgalactosamine-specific phosphotransferase system component IIB
MKLETSFEKKINILNKNNLHKKFINYYNNLPSSITQLNNLIVYGPNGIGKYSQSLKIIEKYSDSNLKYEKNIIINNNDVEHVIKISDIHYEIDINTLGCNSKILWNIIYNKIIDSILIKPDKNSIILIKNFENINNDLLEILYDYMQTKLNSTYNITFIILTNSLGFIPINIINRSEIIHFSRPSKNCYQTTLQKNFKIDSNDIDNINYILNNTIELCYKTIYSDKLIDYIININNNNNNMYNIRDNIYNLFIYNYNIQDSMFYILNYLIINNYIDKNNCEDLFIKLIDILYYYNNNYRQVFHLERFIVYLINKVNGFK